MSVVAPGVPDHPHDLHVVSTAIRAVTIGWTPGFDGGHNQTFRITVLDQKTGRQIREGTLDSDVDWWVNRTTVADLRPHTSYIIRVRAKNKAGMSEQAQEVFVKTRGE